MENCESQKLQSSSKCENPDRNPEEGLMNTQKPETPEESAEPRINCKSQTAMEGPSSSSQEVRAEEEEDPYDSESSSSSSYSSSGSDEEDDSVEYVDNYIGCSGFDDDDDDKWWEKEAIGEECLVCGKDVADSPIIPQLMEFRSYPDVAVLPCGHVFHQHCFQLFTITNLTQHPPPCFFCD